MKKLIATTVAAAAIASGAVIAADGPAPLTLGELDTVSAGASAYASGSTQVRWDYYGVSVDNNTDADARGYSLEAADASQKTYISAASIGGLVFWEAAGSTQSSAAAVSYYPYNSHRTYGYGY